jgi:GxxExxY protein
VTLNKYDFDELSNIIIGIAIDVHKSLGPGFIESIYHNAMKRLLDLNNIKYDTEKEVAVYLNNYIVGKHRMDLIVKDNIVVELKAVEEISRTHIAQVISYLKASGLELGLILNFAKSKLEIRRVILSKNLKSKFELKITE